MTSKMTTREKIRKAALPLLAAALLLPLPSCVQPLSGGDVPEDPSARPAGWLAARLEDAPPTKISVDGTTGFCTWATEEPKDRIAVWVSGTSTTTPPVTDGYIDCEVTVRPASADLRVGGVTLPVSGTQKREHYAVFPAASAVAAYHTAADFRVRYPASYDLSGVPAASLENYAQLPMVACNDAVANPSLLFYHVGGVLRLHLSNASLAGATTVKVTFIGKEVTGVFKVVDGPGTGSGRTENAPVSDGGNEVTFTVPAVGAAGETWVNVPLPWGDYSGLKAVQVDVGGGVSKTQVKAAPWSDIARRQGKKLEFTFSGPGALSYVDIASDEAVTVWKDQDVPAFEAAAFDADGVLIASSGFSWTSSDPEVATVTSDGKVTARSAGATTIKASYSAGGVTKEDSFMLYVNEASVTLKPASLLGRVGKTRKISAEVTYTRNGAWSVPELSWTSSDAATVTLAETATLPGEDNTVNFHQVTAPSSPVSVTASILASDGTTVASDACDVEVVHKAYVPGKFTVSEGKSVWFASGNVVFEANYNGSSSGKGPGAAPAGQAPAQGAANRVWKFADNQWDYYVSETIGDDGIYRYDHLGWATAGVGNGTYASDETHKKYFPWQISNAENQNTNNYYGYGPYSESSSWTKSDNLPYGSVVGNTWRGSSVERYCDWGVNFDDAGNMRTVPATFTEAARTWYTLSAYEWNYLLTTRYRALQLYGLGMILTEDGDYVAGLIVLPDNWECPEDCSFVPSMDYSANAYGATGSVPGRHGSWEEMEAAGAVFLPAAGYRNGSSFDSNGSSGYYWSSGADDGFNNGYCAYYLNFHSGNVYPQFNDARCNGLSVRLVHD